MVLYIRDFLACAAAVAFFSMIMYAPKKTIPAIALSGAGAYTIYRVIYINTGHEILGYFIAAVVIAVLAEVLARIYKMPATIFVFPGIIPLVPGVGLYRTMLLLVQNDFNGFMQTGSQTLLISGTIAAAVAAINVFSRKMTRLRKI